MKVRRLRRCRLWVEELESRLVPSAVLAQSTNWSGYAIGAGHGAVSYVSGAWTVPAATSYGYSASWVGIDGLNSRTVEQIGTESDFIDGQAQYYAWYEMYPHPTVVISQPIAAGDSIVASVAYAAGSGFTLTINASSWSSPFTKTIGQSTAVRSSAEWVVEAPSARQVLPLANFGTETFTDAKATVGGVTGGITTAGAKAQVDQIDMVTNRGGLKDTTSALNPAGTGFTVTFNSSGTTRFAAAQPSANGGKGSGTRDINQVVAIVLIVNQPAPAFTPTLVNLPVQTPTAPLPPLTVQAPPAIAAPVLVDPFYGTPGVSDALPAGAGNAPERGIVPGGPAQVPPMPVLQGAPQLGTEGIATPPASSMVLPQGNEGAAMVQDEADASHELADTSERTVEVAGMVLVLALGTSCGVSLGDREARNKPIAI